MTLPLVRVTWTDAWFDDGQLAESDFRSEYLVQTVGFLIRSSPVLSVAAEILPDGEGYRGVTHIPVSLARPIEYLSAAKTVMPGTVVLTGDVDRTSLRTEVSA